MEQFDPILSYGEPVEDDKDKFARGHKALKVNLSNFPTFGKKILVTKNVKNSAKVSQLWLKFMFLLCCQIRLCTVYVR